MKNVINHGVRNGAGWCYWQTPSAVIARLAPESLVSEFLVTRSGYFPRCFQSSAWRPNPLRDAVFTLCLEGLAWVRDIRVSGSPAVSLRPGEILVVPPDTPHFYAADDHTPWTQLWFCAEGPRVSRFLSQLGVVEGLHKGRISELKLVVESIHRINQLRRGGCNRAVLLESATLGEFVLARLHAEGCLEAIGGVAPREIDKGAAERVQKLGRVRKLVEDKFREPLTLADLAQACHMSPSWLEHAFQDYTGFTPLGFVIHLRLQEACRLLVSSNEKLATIAAAIGYDDPFYFSRLFKKHIGIAPDAYRRESSKA